jgi:hypothetical protein
VNLNPPTPNPLDRMAQAGFIELGQQKAVQNLVLHHKLDQLAFEAPRLPPVEFDRRLAALGDASGEFWAVQDRARDLIQQVKTQSYSPTPLATGPLADLHRDTGNIAKGVLSIADAARWQAAIRNEQPPDAVKLWDITSQAGAPTFDQLVTEWNKAHPRVATYQSPWVSNPPPLESYLSRLGNPDTPDPSDGPFAPVLLPLDATEGRKGSDGVDLGIGYDLMGADSQLTRDQKAIVDGVNAAWMRAGWPGIYQVWKNTEASSLYPRPSSHGDERPVLDWAVMQHPSDKRVLPRERAHASSATTDDAWTRATSTRPSSFHVRSRR